LPTSADLIKAGYKMAEIYTMKQWQADRDFKAEPGQEIDADIYDEMLNVMPPLQLPADKARQALRDYNTPIHAGFLMGEPTDSSPQGLLYRAFGANDYGKGKHYYYLGLSLPARRLNGSYYYFDCMNAFVNDGLFKAAEFDGDADAIRHAANYEATLYKYEYKDGERISSAILYEPRFI